MVNLTAPNILDIPSVLIWVNNITSGLFGIGFIVGFQVVIFFSLIYTSFKEQALLVASAMGLVFGLFFALIGIMNPLFLMLFFAELAIAIFVNHRLKAGVG